MKRTNVVLTLLVFVVSCCGLVSAQLPNCTGKVLSAGSGQCLTPNYCTAASGCSELPVYKRVYPYDKCVTPDPAEPGEHCHSLTDMEICGERYAACWPVNPGGVFGCLTTDMLGTSYHHKVSATGDCVIPGGG